jgi:hypothetical protein
MPSTYTLNNGIELIGTGEQSGTWGDTTNTNLGLLDAALDGQVTITLGAAGSSGSPNALPITDGTASNGRNRMVVFADGGDLGATAYVQLTPNDAEKIIYIRNSLSGSRSVILFQGTYNASNDYEVPAGTTAVVYFDGAGAGAVAANVFNNAHFDALNVVGAASIGSLVIAGTAVTATAAELNLLDGSIAGTVVNSKAVIYGAAGQVEATTVEFDNLSGTGAVSVTNILDEDNMASDSATALATQQSIKAYVDAQVGTVDTLAEILAIGNTTGGTDLAVSAGDDITFTNSSKAIFGTGSSLEIYGTGTHSFIKELGTGNLYIDATSLSVRSATGEPYIVGTADAGVSIYYDNALKLATTATGIDVTGTIDADSATISGSVSGFGGGEVRLGTSAANLDSAVSTYGSGTASMFFDHRGTSTGKWVWRSSSSERMTLDASGNLGIGTSSPSSKLHVVSSSGENKIISEATAASQQASMSLIVQAATPGQTVIYMGKTGATTNGQLGYDPNTDAMTMFTNNAERMRIDSSGNVGIGTSSPATLAHVYSSSQDGGKLLIQSGTLANNNRAALFMSSQNVNGHTGNVSIECIHPNNQQSDLVIRTGATDATSFGTERLRVTTTGYVGIGTASPSYKLHVSGSQLYLTNSGNTELMTTNTSGGTVTGGIQALSNQSVRVGSITDYPVEMVVNNSVKMTIDSSGKLLVGCTATPNVGLTGQFGFSVSPTEVVISKDGADGIYIRTTSASSNAIRFYNLNTQIGSITTTISATAYNTSSDYRLKTDAQPMTGASARVQALKPVNFEWISSGDRVDGFLAHEAQAVVPECVTGTKDAMRDEEYEVTAAVYEDIIIAAVLDEEGNELESERTEQNLVTEAVMGTRSVPDYQGIDQSKLVPLLTAALQEALTKIADMEIRLSALEG